MPKRFNFKKIKRDKKSKSGERSSSSGSARRTESKATTTRIHATQQDAEAYILDNLHERAWALVDVRAANDGAVEYAIRMNSSTVPSTTSSVAWRSFGIDRTYLRYYFSGFLTLQREIDAYFLRRGDPNAPPLSERAAEEGGEFGEAAALELEALADVEDEADRGA